MDVIFVKHVRKHGKIGDIVKVKDGFGRNYLIPQKLAIRATENNKKLLEQQKAGFEEKNEQAKIEAEVVAKTIIGKELVFIKQSSDDGRLFGSVNNREIAKKLAESTSQDIDYSNIILESPIKSKGVFSVEVMLHAEVSVNILVIVARTDSEASEALLSYKASLEPATSEV